MHRVVSSIVALSLCLSPVTLPLIAQRSVAQTQNAQAEEVQQLLQQAWQQTQQGQPQAAIETFEQILGIARQMNLKELEGIALLGIGRNYDEIGKPQEALEFYDQALRISQQTNNRQFEATTLNNIGAVYSNIGQPQEALDYYQQALPILREVGYRYGEATTLNSIGSVYSNIGQPEKALDYYQQALPITREVEDRSGEATTLNNIGLVYHSIGQPQQALDYYQQALPIRREVQDRSGEATTLNNIGLVYHSIGQPQQALDYYQQALPIRREVEDRAAEATTLNNIAGVYSNIGQPQKALDYYQQALPIRREVQDRSGAATTLNNMGEVYHNMGRPQEALDYFQQALPITQEVGDRAAEAATVNNIAVVYSNIGQPQEALDYYQQALLIVQEVGDKRGQARTLNNIGSVYSSIGQPQKALDYHQQALPITREVQDRSGEATSLNNIGLVYISMGQAQQALDSLQQALPITREVQDRVGEAVTLNNIGTVYDKISQPQKALDYFQQALPIRREVGDRGGEATTLNNIGLVYFSMGQPQEALDYFQQALPITQEVEDRSGEATTLSNISLVYRDTNKPTDAINSWEQSLDITLEIRAGLLRENRKAFIESNKGTAVALIDLLIKQNKADRAYEWVNLASTVDIIDFTRLIDAKVKNPQAQQEIDRWNQDNQRLQFLRQRLNDEFSEQLSRKIRELEAQVNAEAEAISRRYPEVAELFETSPTDIALLRASIPQGTVVIQPVLLTNVDNVPNTIAIFLLTRDRLTLTQLAIEPSEFEALVAQYREILTNRTTGGYRDVGAQLYDLLIRPVEAEIEALSPSQLSVIATGKLRSLPFETLYDSQTQQYLIEKYPINYLTRISTRAIAAPTTPQPRRLLALGNPVTVDPYGLESAETEASNIVNIFPGSEDYLRELATLDTFKTQAPRFPLLHLATHGCFQPDGCCLGDECKETRTIHLPANTILFANNEYFNIADAATLGLENTELIALSACQTAMDTESNGIELAGVAYLFERAGARAVMATLWNVDDEATKALMVSFYQYLQQGMSKSEALRQAKLEVIKSSPHPFYWSPLIIIGDGG